MNEEIADKLYAIIEPILLEWPVGIWKYDSIYWASDDGVSVTIQNRVSDQVVKFFVPAEAITDANEDALRVAVRQYMALNKETRDE